MSTTELIYLPVSLGEAIDKLRHLRPGSVETDEQERFVHTFAVRKI